MDPQHTHTNAHTCKQTCIPRQSFAKAIRASEIPMISSFTEQRHTHALTYLLALERISKNKENHKCQHQANYVTWLLQTFPMFTWLFCYWIDILLFMHEQRICGKYLFLYHVAIGGVCCPAALLSSIRTVVSDHKLLKMIVKPAENHWGFFFFFLPSIYIYNERSICKTVIKVQDFLTHHMDSIAHLPSGKEYWNI